MIKRYLIGQNKRLHTENHYLRLSVSVQKVCVVLLIICAIPPITNYSQFLIKATMQTIYNVRNHLNVCCHQKYLNSHLGMNKVINLTRNLILFMGGEGNLNKIGHLRII